jgi:hypothetical protein
MTVLVSLLFASAPSPSHLNGIAMHRIAESVYVEFPATSEDLTAATRDVHAAYAGLHRAFSPDPSFRATVLVCRTARCKIAFGAAPRAAPASDLGFAAVTFSREARNRAVVVTGPNASTARVLTHELVHARMKSWAPYDALPTWFNEGLATAIADEPSCAAFTPSSEIDVTALATKAEWQAYLEATGETLRAYCQARYATEAWSSFASMRELGAQARALAVVSARGSAEDTSRGPHDHSRRLRFGHR